MGMKIAIKKNRTAIIVSAFSLAVLFVVATILAQSPAEKLKTHMLKAASERIGRDVSAGTFGGNPFTGFSVRHITVASADPGKQDTVKIDAMRFRISFRELLKGRITVSRVNLIRPSVSINIDESGHSDIDDIIESFSESAPKPKGPSVLINKITIQDGDVMATINRDSAEEVVINATNINASLISKGKDLTLAETSVRLNAEIEGIQINAKGKVKQSAGGAAVRFNIETDTIELSKPPAALAAFIDAEIIKKLKISGDAKLSVIIDGDLAAPDLEFKADMKKLRALDHDFGAGVAAIKMNRGGASFNASMESSEASLDATGTLGADASRAFSSEISFAGIYPDALAAALAPEAPKVLLGVADGKIALEGSANEWSALSASAFATVKEGSIRYPSPALRGGQGTWADIPFKTLTVSARHKQPDIVIDSVKLDGAALTASASGWIKYTLDALTNAPASPARYDFSIVANSKNIGDVLKHNPSFAGTLTGEFAASARVNGRSDSLDKLNADAAISIFAGIVANPYDVDSISMPADLNLSKFSFHSFDGQFHVGNETVGINRAALRSPMINADVAGAIGFNGDLNLRATASLPPAVLKTIKDFKPVASKLGKLSELKDVETSFDVTGNVNNPKVYWDVERLLRGEAERLISKEAEKLLDKAKQKLGGSSSENKDAGDGESLKDAVKNRIKDILR